MSSGSALPSRSSTSTASSRSTTSSAGDVRLDLRPAGNGFAEADPPPCEPGGALRWRDEFLIVGPGSTRPRGAS